MRSTPNSVIARLGLLLVSVLGVAGCALQGTQAQNETNRYPSFGLETANPVDLALLPIIDNSGGAVPVRTLRNELYLGLAEKHYSPISLNYVDVNWVEASHDMSSLEADGVLRVVVDKWDTSLLLTHGALGVEFAVEILDGRVSGAEPLWGARLTRRLELVSGVVTQTRAQLFELAAEQAAAEILNLIPSRNPANR